MKTSNVIALSLCAALWSCASPRQEAAETPLYTAFEGRWTLGAALNEWQVSGQDSLGQAIWLTHFNSAVAENCMKNEVVQPRPGDWHFDKADAFVKLCRDHGKEIIGHCLAWHSQMAPWFVLRDPEGAPLPPKPGETAPPPSTPEQWCAPDTLEARLRQHIATVAGRYKGHIKGWDVVNECVEADGSFRQSPLFKILGTRFIYVAFEAAHQADPDAELYLNDFGMDSQAKCATYCALIDTLRMKGLRIDAIGMQGHMGIDYPNFAQWEASLSAYERKGVKVMLTEWDMSALPTIHESANVAESWHGELSDRPDLNPYPNGLPDSVATLWSARIDSVLAICLRHSDTVQRVTTWGVTDGDSWKNGFPVPGRTDYPLLFDRCGQLKPGLTKYLPKK